MGRKSVLGGVQTDAEKRLKDRYAALDQLTHTSAGSKPAQRTVSTDGGGRTHEAMLQSSLKEAAARWKRLGAAVCSQPAFEFGFASALWR
jgi:hypothetical protein